MRGLILIGTALVVAWSAGGSDTSQNPVAATSVVPTQRSTPPSPTQTTDPFTVVPAGNQLNNREWASVFWLSLILLLLLLWRETRPILVSLLPIAAHRTVWLSFTVLLVWTGILVALAYRIHLWSTDLIKDTVIWSGSAAVALFFSLTDVARKPHFFRRAAAATLKFTPFVEFYVNLYVFPLLVELISQPVITVLVMLSFIAGRDQKDRTAKVVINGLLSMVGLALFVFVAVSLIHNWHQIDWPDTLRRLVLPIWLTLGVLPYLYALSLFFNYQQAFRLLRRTSQDPMAIRRAKLALLTELNVRTRTVGNFGIPWPDRLTAASSLREARRVVHEFRASTRGGTGDGSEMR